MIWARLAYMRGTAEYISWLRPCSSLYSSPVTYDIIKGMLVTLDLIVLAFPIVSLVLTVKTLRRAYRLGKAMGQFYHNRLHLPLSWWERRSLFSLWHYFNITSDLLISAGTLYKILLDFDVRLDIIQGIKHHANCDICHRWFWTLV